MKVLFLNPQQEMGGIQCLSAYLKQHGHQTALVNDANLFDNPWVQYPRLAAVFSDPDSIIEQIRGHGPDLIALSVVTDEYVWAQKWAARIKAAMDVPIVVGNVQATFHPKDVLALECVDFIVRGEGEITLLELVECLAGQREFSSVLGLGYKEHGEMKINAMRPLIEDLDTLPFPDKDLYYDVMPYLNRGYTTMTGRGCPYRCTFCDNNTSMKLYSANVEKKQKWTRRHSPEYVIREIKWAKERYGIEHVRFNDEDFSYDKKWMREFCALWKAEVGLPYFAWVYPNTMDEEMCRLLGESGCEAVEMGIQSGAEHLRKEVLNRKTKDQQIIDSCHNMRKHGIKVTVDIIIGLPTETKEDLNATVRLLTQARPWHLYAFWLRYYPSAEIISLAKERKLLTPQQIAKIESGVHTRGHLSGGTSLEEDSLSRSYHAFVVLLPVLPVAVVNFCLKYDLIQYFPAFLSPFFLQHLTKILRPDGFNEFRARGWGMLWAEGKSITALILRRCRDRLVPRLRPASPSAPTGPGTSQTIVRSNLV